MQARRGRLLCACGLRGVLEERRPGGGQYCALAVRRRSSTPRSRRARRARARRSARGSSARATGGRACARRRAGAALRTGSKRFDALDRLADVRRRRLFAGRGERLGVVGDEVLVHPVGAVARDPQRAQVVLDVVDEGARLVRRGRRGATGAARPVRAPRQAARRRTPRRRRRRRRRAVRAGRRTAPPRAREASGERAESKRAAAPHRLRRSERGRARRRDAVVSRGRYGKAHPRRATASAVRTLADAAATAVHAAP